MSENNVMLLESLRREEPAYPQVRDDRSWRRRMAWLLGVFSAAAVALLIHYWLPLTVNVAATRAIQSFTAPGLKEFMRLVSGFGNAPKVVAITAIVLLVFNRRSEAFFLAFSGLGGWLIARQLKHLFAAPRPTADLVSVFHHWPNGSFPSGHLVFYVCYFGFLFVIARNEMPSGSVYRRIVLVFLALMIALVALSRVYLGEHWVSDLTGSYLLGFVWLALSVKVYRTWLAARDRQRRLALGVAGWN